MGAPHRVRAALPGSIHSLLAARLDTLSPEQKAMLSDAAVVGKVFWAGAVAAMGDRAPEDVTSAMRELHRQRARADVPTFIHAGRVRVCLLARAHP